MAQEALYELKVVAGKDAGKVIPLEGPSITLARSSGGFNAGASAIQFEEPSIARVHAILQWNSEERVYTFSNRSPISPLMANGTPAASGRLVPGLRLQMGQLILEVVGREGSAPADSDPRLVSVVPPESGFLGEMPDEEKARRPAWLVPQTPDAGAAEPSPPPVPAPESRPPETARKARKKKEAEETAAPSEPAPKPSPKPEPVSASASVAEPPAFEAPSESKRMTGFIEVLKGSSKGRKFQVLGEISIGRSPDCGISLPDSQVSRKHCSLVIEGDRFILVHESKTSTTKVGRTVVRSRQPLQDEEEITLADRVVLRWKKN